MHIKPITAHNPVYSIVGPFWIGISDIIKEDRWVYSSDLQPVKVTDFYPGQPNENTSANCVALRIILLLVFQDYWDDLPCSEHFNFICETKEKYVDFNKF